MGKLEEFLESKITEGATGIYGDELNAIVDELLKFKEFENVKKINVLNTPIYMASATSGKPILFDEDFIGGDTVLHTHDRKMYVDKVNSFNEEIDVFGLELTPFTYNHGEIDKVRSTFGVWRLPTLYDPTNFNPMCGIVVNWAPDAIQTTPEEGEKNALKLKERLIRLFTEALESDKPTIRMRRGVIIRCSPRSYIKTIVD
jgi:hypothetical protein